MNRFYLIKTANGCIIHDRAYNSDFAKLNLFELNLSFNDCLALGEKIVDLMNDETR